MQDAIGMFMNMVKKDARIRMNCATSDSVVTNEINSTNIYIFVVVYVMTYI